MINKIIKDYCIKSELGQGGMATVYLSENQLLGNKIAFKLLNKEFIHHENIRKRFLAEARSMARMSHPNIIKVTDLIDDGSTVAFVMEYVEGETLKEYIERKGKLSDDEIKSIFSQMLDAVGYVHEQNLVHRDIKPSNFMVSPKGIVKLMDFGIAKNTDASSAEYTQTGTGVQMGTPMYMSPEQITETKSVTPRSDIYSLGVVLWQMVTGEKPYDMKTLSTFHLQNKIVTEKLPLTNTFFDSIIEKATQKEVKKRYLNSNAFKEAIYNTSKNTKRRVDLDDDKTTLEHKIEKEVTKEKPVIDSKLIKQNQAANLLELRALNRLRYLTKVQIICFFLVFFFPVIRGLIFYIIILNLLILISQFNQISKVGKSKFEIILNLCSSIFILLNIYLSDYIPSWQFYFPILFKLFNLFIKYGLTVLVLLEIIFSIRSLLKINKINNLA